LVPAPIKDNVSFGVSLGFDAKTIKLHNKECSIENLRWQLLKFVIETVDEMKTFPYRFIYKALRKCKQISLAEELVECLNQDQDLMSVELDGKIGIIISSCFFYLKHDIKKNINQNLHFDFNEFSNVLCSLYCCVTFPKFCVFPYNYLLLIFSTIIIYPPQKNSTLRVFFKTRKK
jgi:hypothetical protein